MKKKEENKLRKDNIIKVYQSVYDHDDEFEDIFSSNIQNDSSNSPRYYPDDVEYEDSPRYYPDVDDPDVDDPMVED